MLQTYSIVEIFYSIQGEGRFTGWPAVFIRLAGCNLKCEWCDTDIKEHFHLTTDKILSLIRSLLRNKNQKDVLIVITGGEPTLQDYFSLVCSLNIHYPGKITMETNGRVSHDMYRLRKEGLLWSTVSPKIGVEDCEIYFDNPMWKGDEIKIVLDPKLDEMDKKNISELPQGRLKGRFSYFYIQPCSGDIQTAIDFVKENPQWKLSLQTQKVMEIL